MVSTLVIPDMIAGNYLQLSREKLQLDLVLGDFYDEHLPKKVLASQTLTAL